MNLPPFNPKILQSRGIQSGDTLYFEFKGADSHAENLDLVQKLQNLVEATGLLVIPTCTSIQGAPKPVFNPAYSSSEMGLLSEIFRIQPGIFRSNHPTHSLAAWGSDAETFTMRHKYAYGRQSPWGESALGFASPWERLWERNAWCVLIDPDWSLSPILDYVGARYATENQGITRETVFPVFSAKWLEANFSRVTGAWEGNWGERRVRVFRLKQAVAGLESALEREPGQCVADRAFQDWLNLRRWVDANGYLQAGVSKVVITPALPFLRWEGKPMTGLYRDLYARTLFLQSGGVRFALVICDLIGITADMTRAVREQVAAAFPENPPVIMIACTHAHSTPDTIGAGFSGEKLLSELVDGIAGGILEASRKLQPVRIGWSKTAIRGIAHSRRMKLQDGKVFTTRYGVPSTWRVKPELVASQGVIDPELAVLRVESLSGELVAVVSNFGVHPSVALASALVSGDINGEAMYALEAALGEDVVALCTTGAAGDVDPTLEMPYWGPRDESNVVHISRMLAAQVLEAVEHTGAADRHSLQIVSRIGRVRMREDWLNLMQTERDKLKSEFPEAGDPSAWISQMIRNGWADVEIQAVRLGELVLVAFPGEVFVRTALQLKKEQDVPLVVLETTNDYIGYIPPEQEYEEGGYECDQHFASRLYPEAEQTLRELAMEAISVLKEGYKRSL